MPTLGLTLFLPIVVGSNLCRHSFQLSCRSLTLFVTLLNIILVTLTLVLTLFNLMLCHADTLSDICFLFIDTVYHCFLRFYESLKLRSTRFLTPLISKIRLDDTFSDTLEVQWCHLDICFDTSAKACCHIDTFSDALQCHAVLCRHLF